MAISTAPASADPNQPTAAVAAVAAVVTNGIRLTAVAEKLASHFHGTLSLSSTDLFQLCYALARGIDYALSSNDVPRVADSIPVLVKKAFRHKDEPTLHSAMMVLMISAKNACRNGWFTVDDRDEIIAMANELSSGFCLSMGLNPDMEKSLETLLKVMPRYFPQLKLCRIINSFEAKIGYDILMSDFFVPRDMHPMEKIRLFVVRTDDMENSSCIASPPLVSFLINGKGVDKRNNVSLETGPQLPTDITKMLKYGTNIIQAAGYFSGTHLIAIAFTAKSDLVNPPVLQNYVELPSDELDPDSELIMDSQSVSLNCSISFGRIKTPVKGHQCKHHQCFDYDNYMEINLRKPIWRCPCCYTTVFHLDLRLDQRMVQILKEVDEHVKSVIILSDGSWKKSEEQNRYQQTVNNTAKDPSKDENQGNNDEAMHDANDGIIDLTGEETGGNDFVETREEDTKPFLDCEDFLHVPHLNSMPPPPQSTIFHSAEDNAWVRGTFSPARGTLDSLIPNSILNPLTTDNFNNISNVINNNNMSSTSMGMTSRAPIPRNATRVSNAVQALPIPNPNPNPNPSPNPNPRSGNHSPSLRNFLNSIAYSSSGLSGSNTVSSSFASPQMPTGTGQGFRGDFGTPNNNGISPYMASRSVPVPNRTYQRPMQHVSVAYRNPSTNSMNQTSSAQRMPPIGIPLSSTHRTQIQSPTTGLLNPTALGPMHQNASESVRPEMPPEHGWRPTGRMRGSLTGEAYSSALNHYLSPSGTQNPSPFSRGNPSSQR